MSKKKLSIIGKSAFSLIALCAVLLASDIYSEDRKPENFDAWKMAYFGNLEQVKGIYIANWYAEYPTIEEDLKKNLLNQLLLAYAYYKAGNDEEALFMLKTVNYLIEDELIEP